MTHDRIISALLGLVGACDSGTPTPDTDALVLRALAFPGSSPDLEARDRLLEDIRAEKHRISPGCATCASPCGNTSDFDMAQLRQAAEPGRSLRLDILARLQSIATALLARPDAPGRPPALFFRRALSWVRCDLDPETLTELLEETRQWGARLEA